jgi:hypothetical protein
MASYLLAYLSSVELMVVQSFVVLEFWPCEAMLDDQFEVLMLPLYFEPELELVVVLKSSKLLHGFSVLAQREEMGCGSSKRRKFYLEYFELRENFDLFT